MDQHQIALVSALLCTTTASCSLGISSVRFSSVSLTLCDPRNCSTPGLPLHYLLPESTQTHVHWVGDAIQPSSSSVIPFSSCLQSSPASGPFLMNWFFASDGQGIGASASASVIPMNIQGWFPLGLIGLISFQTKGLSRV